jgi:hypothetical protein
MSRIYDPDPKLTAEQALLITDMLNLSEQTGTLRAIVGCGKCGRCWPADQLAPDYSPPCGCGKKGVTP